MLYHSDSCVFSLVLPKLSNREVTTDNIKLNNSAHQKPSTLKSVTISAANKIINALITSKKNPKVTTVMGMVSSIMMGLTTAFKNASTEATISAVIKLLSTISTPGKKYADIKTAREEMIN